MVRLRAVLATLVLVNLLTAGAALAQTCGPERAATRYETAPRSTDGIGKRYMGREIAQVMGYPGAQWLERPERKQEERPDLVVAQLGLAPGMVVADFGAGTGYFTSMIAKAVGPSGKVWAVDVQPEMLRLLARNMAQAGVNNYEAMLGTSNDPRLPAGALDLIVMVDVYHELEFPCETLEKLVASLKPGGRIVFVEYRGADLRVPIKPLHTMTVAQIRREAEVFSLTWERTYSELPWQHVVVFRK